MFASNSRRGALRAILRERTDAVHQALHLHPAFAVLAGPGGTRGDYAALMQGLGGFYAALDPVLLDAARASGGPGYVARAPLIARDLAALGLQPARAEAAFDPPDGRAGLVGMLYVVEGSTLGGSVMARRAADVAGEAASGFWRWCREGGGAGWKALTAHMDRTDWTAAEQDGAAVAAQRLFADLARHLDGTHRALAA